jgi:hypothetical protein
MMVMVVVVVMMTMTVARTPLMRARVVVVPGCILVERMTAVMTVSAHVNAVPGDQVLVLTVHSSIVPVEIEVECFQIALVSMVMMMMMVVVMVTTSLELTRTRHKSRQGQFAKRRFLLQPNKPRSDAQFANYKEELTSGWYGSASTAMSMELEATKARREVKWGVSATMLNRVLECGWR